jgi:hypothetical protein
VLGTLREAPALESTLETNSLLKHSHWKNMFSIFNGFALYQGCLKKYLLIKFMIGCFLTGR